MKGKRFLARLGFAIHQLFPVALLLAYVQADASAETNPAPLPLPERGLLQVKVFADRSVLKRGETVNIKVWIESEAIEGVTATAFSANQLQLDGENSPQLHLPLEAPVTFSFIGVGAGKSNILIQVKGQSKDGKHQINEVQQVQDIEVKESSYSLSSLFPASLAGVVIGSLLTVGTHFLNDKRQKQKEVAEKRGWLTASLSAQLQADQIAVSNGKKTEVGAWSKKLLTEGYQYHLIDLIKKHPDQSNLPREIIEVISALQIYEENRIQDRLLERQQLLLSDQLDKIAQRLRELL